MKQRAPGACAVQHTQGHRTREACWLLRPQSQDA